MLVNYLIYVQPVVVGDACVVVLSIFVVEEGFIVVWDVELWEDFVAVLGVYVFVEDEYGAVVVDCVVCEVEKAVVVVEGSKTRQVYQLTASFQVTRLKWIDKYNGVIVDNYPCVELHLEEWKLLQQWIKWKMTKGS